MTSPDLRRQLVLDGAHPPDDLRRLAGALRPGARVTPLWRNELEGWTVRLDRADAPTESTVLKWVPAETLRAHPDEPSPEQEAARLSWIADRHPVPRLLDHGTDAASGAQWMHTVTITGASAVSDRWRSEPRTAVCALGEGLRALHEALPVQGCPWTFETSGPTALTGPVETGGAPVGAFADRVGAFADRVVLHGDACAPNTLLDESGRWVAHVDLGLLGVGDRWLDLAVGAQSLEWNYGPGWEGEYLAAYGIAPNAERMRAWRDWWNGVEAAEGDHAESEP